MRPLHFFLLPFSFPFPHSPQDISRLQAAAMIVTTAAIDVDGHVTLFLPGRVNGRRTFLLLETVATISVYCNH